ncbi:hypothetical protein H4582DRAFT_630320 [Lactarius indigo]|nr:hypothetical protein H4582DRAFT_630320 [Lactarius indigo]
MTPIWRFYRRAAARSILLVSQTRATAAVDITASDRGLLIGGGWRRYLRRARACPFYSQENDREKAGRGWEPGGCREHSSRRSMIDRRPKAEPLSFFLFAREDGQRDRSQCHTVIQSIGSALSLFSAAASDMLFHISGVPHCLLLLF